LITELRPAALDQLGLEAALQALVDRVGVRGLDVDANVDLAYEQGRARGRLSPELETGVYRVVQESLTNAIKHGGANRAILEVLEDAGSISVTVRDDGAGFDPSASTKGFGLIGMHERVELLGGRIGVESAPGEGVTVNASFPATHRDHESGTATSLDSAG
jgi:signal transduction histidine kinase